MNRRSFLGVLGLAPIGAWAFGPTQKTSKLPPKQSALPSFTAISASPVREFECIVGDLRENFNGHTYRREIWKRMFAGMPYHGPYVMMSDGSEPYLRLDRVAGHIVDWGFRSCLVGDNYTDQHINIVVWVKMRALETPQGRVLTEAYQRLENLRRQGIQAGLAQFLTPVGAATLADGGIISDDYAFKYFAISNNSAFECATPLESSKNFKGLIPIMAGGEALKYPPSMMVYLQRKEEHHE